MSCSSAERNSDSNALCVGTSMPIIPSEHFGKEHTETRLKLTLCAQRTAKDVALQKPDYKANNSLLVFRVNFG